jgi:hypothetical protein
LAAPKHPSALRDDCAQAEVLVLRHDRPSGCAPGALVIDAAARRREGAHALSLSGDGVVVSTVGQVHGHRPWTFEPGAQEPRRPRTPRRAPAANELRPSSGLVEVAGPENEPATGDD